MTPEQYAFIEAQILAMTIMATAQRGSLYRVGASEGERQALRSALRTQLSLLTEEYRIDVAESRHLANIEALANSLSLTQSNVLKAGRFRIGSAQKALNLYLKYMWCLGIVATPPHCPFDAIVLSRIPGCDDVKWTKLDSPTEYERIVRAAKLVAADVCLAEWELHLYNDEVQRAHPGGRQRRGSPGNGIG